MDTLLTSEKAETLFEEGDYTAALKEFESLLSIQSLSNCDKSIYQYKIMMCYINLGSVDHAKSYILKEGLHKTWIEPSYQMCKALREKGDRHAAFYFYSLATKCTKSIPVQSTIESYALDFEASVLWYYVSNDKKYGLRIIRNVIKNAETPYNIARCAHDNTMFYVQPIGGTVMDSKPKIFEPGWFYTTPPFIGKDIVYRLVNYEIDNNGCYCVRDPNNVVRTRNLWIGKGLLRVEDNPALISSDDKPVKGLEDLRLIETDSGVYGLAASWEYCKRHTSGVVQVLIKIDKTDMVTRVLSVLSDGDRCEKNWVWVSFPYTVYEWFPNILIKKLTTSENECNAHISDHKRIPSSPLLRFARGSSNGVHFNNGRWFVIHTVIDGRTQIRRYLHYIVVLDSDLETLTCVSLPFIFEEGADIEFCTAFAVDLAGLTLGYSIRDGSPRTRKTSWIEAWSLMP